MTVPGRGNASETKNLRSKPSHCNYKKAQGLDNIVIDK